MFAQSGRHVLSLRCLFFFSVLNRVCHYFIFTVRNPACSKGQLHLHSWSILKYRFGLPECNPNSLIQPFAHKSQKETSWDLRLFQSTSIQHNVTFDASEILLTIWDGQKEHAKK